MTDADDATMTVECTECGDSYLVEPDAFGDGCMPYYFPFLARQEGTPDHYDTPAKAAGITNKVLTFAELFERVAG